MARTLTTLDDWRKKLAPVTRTDYRLMYFEIGVKQRRTGDPRRQGSLDRKWRVKDEMILLGWDVCDGVMSQNTDYPHQKCD